jgi:hypothetical protein
LAYPWSSFGYYLSAPEHRPHWMRVDRLLGEHGIGQDTPAGRQQFEQRMEARRLEPGDDEALKVLRNGWYIGSERFRQEQLARMEGKLGDHHSGELRRETAEAKAERIIAEELPRLGWSGYELSTRRKNDPGKMAIAVRLRRETTLSIKDIANRVHLGTSNTANARLHKAIKELIEGVTSFAVMG